VFYLDPVLNANIYNSIFNSDASQSWATPQYTCSSGNCTFESITTIAARARCHNLTDLLHTDCDAANNCTVSIGLIDDQGVSLSYRPGQSGQLIRIDTVANLSAPHAASSNNWNRLPIVQYIMIQDFNRVLRDHHSTTESDTPFLAAECEISIGVQAVQDSIKNAEHSAEEIGFWRYGEPATITTSNLTLAAWWRDLTGQWDSAPIEDLSMPGQMLVLPPGFEFGYNATKALINFSQAIFDGIFSAGALSDGWMTSSKGGDYPAIGTTQ
jgi:hypothetical protein